MIELSPVLLGVHQEVLDKRPAMSLIFGESYLIENFAYRTLLREIGMH